MVVDDSIVYRSGITVALSKVPWLKVVGSARNGLEAFEFTQNNPVDLVILDIEMPQWDGVKFLQELQSLSKRPRVLVFSSYTDDGAEKTIQALDAGANDFCTKPTMGNGRAVSSKILDALLPKIKALIGEEREVSEQKVSPFNIGRYDIVVIGASTGGPKALTEFFKLAGKKISKPIVVVQHMPALFTTSFARSIAKATGKDCHEAIDGEEIKNGFIYLAPGDYHLTLKKKGGSVFVSLNQEETINFVRPSVDPLFTSASEIFNNKLIGIVFSGMGHDGRYGAQVIKGNNGRVLIQDKLSSVVFGMPGSIYQDRNYDFIGSPQQIAECFDE